jgi:hypothetical protein
MRALAALVLFTAAFTSSGCFGGFNLSRSLYRQNKRMDEKWAKEGVFLVFLPLYAGTMILDLLIFNPVEFFSDHNPIEVEAGGVDDDTTP